MLDIHLYIYIYIFNSKNAKLGRGRTLPTASGRGAGNVQPRGIATLTHLDRFVSQIKNIVLSRFGIYTHLIQKRPQSGMMPFFMNKSN